VYHSAALCRKLQCRCFSFDFTSSQISSQAVVLQTCRLLHQAAGVIQLVHSHNMAQGSARLLTAHAAGLSSTSRAFLQLGMLLPHFLHSLDARRVVSCCPACAGCVLPAVLLPSSLEQHWEVMGQTLRWHQGLSAPALCHPGWHAARRSRQT
jgi:hypothetical protein